MTVYADPHQRYREMLRTGRRKPLTSRMSPVEKNPSVVVKLSEGAAVLSEIQGLRGLSAGEREERLKLLKGAIQEGRYRVDSFLIAQAVLEGDKALKMLSEDMDDEDEDAPLQLDSSDEHPEENHVAEKQ